MEKRKMPNIDKDCTHVAEGEFKAIKNHRQDIKLDESQAPKIPSQVEVNASKVLGDVSGCPVIKTINEIKKEIEELLSDLDSYGYSREETLKDLEQENSEIVWNVKKKCIGLKTELKAYQTIYNNLKSKRKKVIDYDSKEHIVIDWKDIEKINE